MRPGGEFICSLNSKESDAWRLFAERRMDDFTLLKTEGPEVDMPHTYLEHGDLIALLADHSILKIQQVHDYWQGRKSGHFFVLCRNELRS